ncbi:hypothetical protein CFIICLFH_1646 [Methylobacterium goesingense]|nr:hypothetical protein CFIICLFH_1646 [Methylobacterium goesingense]
MVSCASPVPGGISTIRMSSSPQATSRSICVMADCTMGPRQIIAVSGSIRKPIDITLMPKPSIGARRRSSMTLGFPESPNSLGTEGP